MSGELTAPPKGMKRHPWDWYVEEKWVTHRLLDVLELENDITYLDPFCGLLHIPQALSERGFQHVYGTDLFARDPGHRLFLGEHDFLGDQRHLLEASRRLSIIMNPPFSCQDGRLVRGLAEKCIRQALSIASHKVCALLPLKWLASEGRYRLFTDETPIGVWILCERPSMPPGNLIEQLGDNAYEHGKVDYMWVVWDKNCAPARDSRGTQFAPTYWIPPREKVAAKARRLLAA
ncbi:class I SAM-dependent methyltransferase [Novosphingobium colocasiae]|uniref:class I SAM-dependent methyltransferase n=1 Tax=Novosphingobium colocasiae TaxID=1256513 RepID=UPI0035B2FBC5